MRTLLYLSLASILFVCGCDNSPPKELGSLEIVSREKENSNVYIKLWVDGDCIGSYSREHSILHLPEGLHTIRAVREVRDGSNPAEGSGAVFLTETFDQQIRIMSHDSYQKIVMVFVLPHDK